MSSQHLPTVGIVGGGIMGAGIAEAAARARCHVTVIDQAAHTVMPRIEQSLAKAVTRGRMSTEEAERTCSRISVDTEIAALQSHSIIIEAVPEIESVKLGVFRELDAIAHPEAVLATNTSSIPVARIAAATSRPDRVVGIHFFNPVPVLPLVELIPGIQTSTETLDTARTFAHDVLRKNVIVARDQAGFVVNALLIPYLLAAVRLLDAGVATAEDIDRGMTDGCAHPIGPLALIDLIGIDTTVSIANSLYDEYRDPQMASPPALSRMLDAGLLGRKSGQGFYTYS